jgi:hypothetical protein
LRDRLYQPETTRSKLTGTWSQDSTAGVAMAVMAQVRSGIFVGGEARYLLVYDGSGFDNLAGQGFFVGPTIWCARSGQFRTPAGAGPVRREFLNRAAAIWRSP